MSFYGTPLKHGKGVNKPFKSPLIKNNDQNDGTPKKSHISKFNQNPRIKSLGLTNRKFSSPMKPLFLTSTSKSVETEASTEAVGNAAPIKRIEFSSPLKRIENNISLIEPRNKHLKLSHDNSPQKKEAIVDLKESKNDSPVKSEIIGSTSKTENLSRKDSSDDDIFCNKEIVIKSIETKQEKLPHNTEVLKTSPISSNILQDSPEYQPVVQLERLSQNLNDLKKQDLALLINRVKNKQRQMVELRANAPTFRKQNLEEIVVSIGKWREAFVEALETVRESLTEKNGRYFSTSDVLKLLSIPNNIVHFSEEENDFIFSKI